MPSDSGAAIVALSPWIRPSAPTPTRNRSVPRSSDETSDGRLASRLFICADSAIFESASVPRYHVTRTPPALPRPAAASPVISWISFGPSEASPVGLKPRLDLVSTSSHFFTAGFEAASVSKAG